jgi:hypothetical protein
MESGREKQVDPERGKSAEPVDPDDGDEIVLESNVSQIRNVINENKIK